MSNYRTNNPVRLSVNHDVIVKEVKTPKFEVNFVNFLKKLANFGKYLNVPIE